MLVNSKNLAVNVDICVKNNCIGNCSKKICKVCLNCIEEENMPDLHRAFNEHTRRGDYKRIFPSKTYFDDSFIATMTPKNEITMRWLKAKCAEDEDWC
jgi:tubulin monoglycylase TTLL15